MANEILSKFWIIIIIIIIIMFCCSGIFLNLVLAYFRFTLFWMSRVRTLVRILSFLSPFSEMPVQKYESLHEVVLQRPSQFNFYYPTLRRYLN